MNNMPSRKPPIAEINKQRAEANILCKLNILEAWAKNGIPYAPNSINTQSKVLEYFPKSIRQFNNWNGTQNSPTLIKGMPSILRNANDTLRAYMNLRLRVAAALDAVAAKAISQSNHAKPLKIKKLSESLALENRLRVVAETELISLRENLRLLKRKSNEERIVFESMQNEFKKLVQTLESQLAHARQDVSDLTARLAKVAPLKKA